MTGTFDESFMSVPDEVLVTSMRSHQKYFSLLKADGKLANHFLVVANMPTGAETQIVEGNQRVLRARVLPDLPHLLGREGDVPLCARQRNRTACALFEFGT